MVGEILVQWGVQSKASHCTCRRQYSKTHLASEYNNSFPLWNIVNYVPKTYVLLHLHFEQFLWAIKQDYNGWDRPMNKIQENKLSVCSYVIFYRLSLNSSKTKLWQSLSASISILRYHDVIYGAQPSGVPNCGRQIGRGRHVSTYLRCSHVGR